MSVSRDYDLFSIKYIAASFFATYFSGVMHPLDLIKTRFQSKSPAIQATTARPPTTLYPSTTASTMLSRTSTTVRASVDSTKASTSPSYVKLPQCHSSFGSKCHLTQV